MSTLRTKLLVWPNPFHALDHEGHPAGILPVEPSGDGVKTFDDRAFVGARLNAEFTFKAIVGTAQASEQRSKFAYTDEPVEVPATPYYKHAIARGEIFAADDFSAKAAGISLGYVDPAELLERARAESIEAYERNPPHEDLDGLVPDDLLFFSFGPMKEAVAKRKKAADEIKKAVEAEQKAALAIATDDAKAEADRQKVRDARRADAAKAEVTAAAEAADAAKKSAADKVVADKAAMDAAKQEQARAAAAAKGDS